jgi:hypothetical protein
MVGILYSRIRLYDVNNRNMPKYECRLNDNNKYDIYTVDKAWKIRHVVRKNVSSSDIQKKLKPKCGGCVYC